MFLDTFSSENPTYQQEQLLASLTIDISFMKQQFYETKQRLFPSTQAPVYMAISRVNQNFKGCL